MNTVDAAKNLTRGKGGDEDAGREAIGYYQAASYAFNHGTYRTLTAEESRQALNEGVKLLPTTEDDAVRNH